MSQFPYALSQAEQDVLDERRAQRTREGFDAAHDDQHASGELAMAAACYATVAAHPPGFYRAVFRPGVPMQSWPWDREWWKPKNDRRDLIRAAALILAEIERLDRAEARKGGAQ